MSESDKLYKEAVAALDRLHLSRTGKAYAAVSRGDSDDDRTAWLKQRAFTEGIMEPLLDVLKMHVFGRHGAQLPTSTPHRGLAQIAEAILKTAEMSLANGNSEEVRKLMSDVVDCSAYYDIDTNEKLIFGDEDLFATLQGMEGRFVWDRNLDASEKLSMRAFASIIGQGLDREEDYWMRKKVMMGNDNLFSFGVVELAGRSCLRIQRLRKNVVSAIYASRQGIPDAHSHYSDLSRRDEVLILVQTYHLGRELLLKQIADLVPYCCGSYQISILTARRCAALLLHDDTPALQSKIRAELEKMRRNHPNVLGDTQHLQNALYFDAHLVTGDKGLAKMGDYCAVKSIS
jgi:hypothetical protein